MSFLFQKSFQSLWKFFVRVQTKAIKYCRFSRNFYRNSLLVKWNFAVYYSKKLQPYQKIF